MMDFLSFEGERTPAEWCRELAGREMVQGGLDSFFFTLAQLEEGELDAIALAWRGVPSKVNNLDWEKECSFEEFRLRLSEVLVTFPQFSPPNSV